MNIGIIGAGSWGLALANTLADNGNHLRVLMRDEDRVRFFNQNHLDLKYLRDVRFSNNIEAVIDVQDISDADLYVFAVPTQEIRLALLENISFLNKDAIFVNVSKGLELSSGKRISAIFSEFIDEKNFVTLSGPTHAEEVSIKMPSAIVVSGMDEKNMSLVQDLFMNSYFRVYTNSDLLGVELGGATKNIIALGLGIVDGLGFGDNAKAAMMTRGMHEIVRLGTKLGGKKETFYGLTGMGDLIVTSTSNHSRNRRFGILIGEGYKIDEAKAKIGMAVEGLATTKAVYELCQNLDIEMPILKEIYAILYEGKTAKESLEMLMDREKKSETLV